MASQRIKVTIVDVKGVVQDAKTFKNPPKTANEILERLQASGYTGDLRDSAGDSLSGVDLLGASQEYKLQLPSFGRCSLRTVSTSPPLTFLCSTCPWHLLAPLAHS